MRPLRPTVLALVLASCAAPDAALEHTDATDAMQLDPATCMQPVEILLHCNPDSPTLGSFSEGTTALTAQQSSNISYVKFQPGTAGSVTLHHCDGREMVLTEDTNLCDLEGGCCGENRWNDSICSITVSDVADSRPDSDGDSVVDTCDVCPGGDDAYDMDGDGTPDDCDDCPEDYFGDSDGDGSCDSDDLCSGSVEVLRHCNFSSAVIGTYDGPGTFALPDDVSANISAVRFKGAAYGTAILHHCDGRTLEINSDTNLCLLEGGATGTNRWNDSICSIEILDDETDSDSDGMPDACDQCDEPTETCPEPPSSEDWADTAASIFERNAELKLNDTAARELFANINNIANRPNLDADQRILGLGVTSMVQILEATGGSGHNTDSAASIFNSLQTTPVEDEDGSWILRASSDYQGPFDTLVPNHRYSYDTTCSMTFGIGSGSGRVYRNSHAQAPFESGNASNFLELLGSSITGEPEATTNFFFSLDDAEFRTALDQRNEDFNWDAVGYLTLSLDADSVVAMQNGGLEVVQPRFSWGGQLAYRSEGDTSWAFRAYGEVSTPLGDPIALTGFASDVLDQTDVPWLEESSLNLGLSTGLKCRNGVEMYLMIQDRVLLDDARLGENIQILFGLRYTF